MRASLKTYKRDRVGDLLKTTPFLLSQIAQQKADATAKACLSSFLQTDSTMNHTCDVHYTMVLC
jgi:hypothetical protein